jgi:hypothetical protein
MEIRLPKEKIQKIKKDMKLLLAADTMTIRKLAAITGLLRSTAVAVFPSKYQTIALIRQIHQALQHPQNTSHNWDWKTSISKEIKESAKWWINNLAAWNGRSMIQEQAEIVIETDASDFGWGYVAKNDKGDILTVGQGRWRAPDVQNSINWRELKAVVIAIDQHAISWSKRTIQIRSDNMTTCSIVNRQGSRQHQHLHSLASKLAYLCDLNKIRLFAKYLPGKENTIADHLSRKTIHPQHEQRLHPQDFQLIEATFGKRTIDLFASNQNNQLPTYISMNRDNQAIAIDAMNCNWPTKAYAFPPWLLINRILAKIQRNPVQELVLVTPHWTTQPWWPELMSLATKNLPLCRSKIYWHGSSQLERIGCPNSRGYPHGKET